MRIHIEQMEIGTIKKRFVQMTLADEGRRLLRNQKGAFERQLTYHSGRINTSRSVAVLSGGEMDGTLQFTHVVYERFLDLSPYKGKDKKKMKNQLHNRFTYGHFSAIARRLSSGFTEEVISNIKKQTKVWQKN